MLLLSVFILRQQIFERHLKVGIQNGAFLVHVPADKLTLYLAKKGARVLRVTFHDTSSWCHEITWICTLIPDKYCPYINHHKFRQQLSALREQFATHGRLTSIQIDRWMFVFGHNTEDTAWEMMTGYEHIKDIILKFLHEIHAQVTDIEMESVIKKVDAAAARKDQGPETLPRGTTDQDVLFCSKQEEDVDAPHLHSQERHDDVPHAEGHEDASHPYDQMDENASHLTTGSETKTGMSGNSRAETSISAGEIRTKELHQDNRTVNSTIIINLPSGKAVCESCWKAKHENIPQPTDTDIETVKILLNELFPDSLVRVRWECMVFCFEHESMEDAMGMIVQHADIKEDILHFLQKLDPSIEDIVMEVEVRELSEFAEQAAQTSASSDPSLKPLVKGQDSDRRATPSQADRDLYYASRDGDLEEVKRLLTTPGVDINSRGELSWTPVMVAAYRGHRDVVELLVSDGADVSLVDVNGNNILHHACMGGDVETVKCVLSLRVVDINSRGRLSRTPVMEAALGGHRDVVELLVSEGADVSLVDKYGDNILHLACMRGHVETVKFVLSLHVVDINSRGERSRTVVMGAVVRRHRDVVELLVSEGADVSLVNKDGDNILHYACIRGDVETVKYVLSLHVVDINSRGDGSRTPLMGAAYMGHRDVVELLVSEGADVSLVDKHGENILHYACMRGDVETVEFVLSLNVVDIGARNKSGRTAAHWARLWGPQPVVELLKSRGAQ
ncbi:ankyrin repeat and KH domain-containing protein mask-like isoform X3 [Haliotis rufescens]|uniref:ankyrin repeat and KH domain-containing protein mask-like isoform X3 n=1 Tax=Haliotis rufescens TaxID=6454 RepID=UPI00201F7C64|nr:ankyrin repeat and KH domain-containing protein mask-like isoform X3 [Haliotis rufescens]